MKPKRPMLIEEVDVEVVNRQPNGEERRSISAFIRAYKAKMNQPSATSTSPAKA